MILRTVFSSFLKCPRALTSHMWPGLFLHYTSRFSPGLPIDFSVTMFHLIFLPPCVPIFTFFSFHLHTPVLFTGFPITHALHPVFSCATSVFFPSRVPPTPVFSCVFLQSCFSTKKMEGEIMKINDNNIINVKNKVKGNITSLWTFDPSLRKNSHRVIVAVLIIWTKLVILKAGWIDRPTN